MNQSTVFHRKIIYLVVLVAMLVPLYLLGQPSDGTSDSGGQLVAMREDFDIAESDLGEISPASQTMKLATLGMRGVAAAMLWRWAHEYKVKHEWDRFQASLNNIALLQPHYDKVWEFQAHNLAYNVSTEFDDYRQRYERVREGTEYLTRGVRQNRQATRLIWYTGWFYGQKMGMSDEKKQFRRLFADDEVLHKALADEGIAVYSNDALGPNNKPDNWLVGRLWLYRGYELFDAGVRIRRQTPLNFFETGPKWSFKHAEAIEEEGILDQNAEYAWTKASEDWDRFGKRSIPTTSPFTIKLGGIDELNEQRLEKFEQLKALAGNIFEEQQKRNVANLPEDLQKVWNKAPEERTEAGKRSMPEIYQMINPTADQLAEALPKAKKIQGMLILDDLMDIQRRIEKTEGYRNQINFVYWESLAMAEQEERTVLARRKIYEAEQANADAELKKAIALYDEAFEIWAEIFDDYPILTIDDSADELYESIRRYMVALDSQEMPEGFPLATFVDMMAREDSFNRAQLYEQVRKEQREKAELRRAELAEEERKREQEAMKKQEAEGKSPETEPSPAAPTDADESDAASSEQEPAKDETATEETPEEASPKSEDSTAEARGDVESTSSESEPESDQPTEEAAADESSSS